MKINARSLILPLCLLAGGADAQAPIPATGQIIGWKSWPNDQVNSPYSHPAGNTDWTPTGFPADPRFIKRFDDTSLTCVAGFDVYSTHPDDNIGMAVFLAGPATPNGIFMAQTLPVGDAGFITHAFTYTRLPNMIGSAGAPLPLPAGTYDLRVEMYSFRHYEVAAFYTVAANLQCYEIALPASQ